MTLREAVELGVLEVEQVTVGNPDGDTTVPMLKTPSVKGHARARIWHDRRHLLPWRWAIEGWPNNGSPGQRHGGARTWDAALRASVLVRSQGGRTK